VGIDRFMRYFTGTDNNVLHSISTSAHPHPCYLYADNYNYAVCKCTPPAVIQDRLKTASDAGVVAVVVLARFKTP